MINRIAIRAMIGILGLGTLPGMAQAGEREAHIWVGAVGHSRCQDGASCREVDTLPMAVDLLQGQAWESLAQGQKTNVRIHLPAGTIRLSAPVALRWGVADATQGEMTIEGVGRDETVLSGAIVLGPFHPLQSAAARSRVPRLVQAHIAEIDLSPYGVKVDQKPQPKGFAAAVAPVTGELFFRGKPLPLAQWPNDGGAAKIVNLDRNDPKHRFSLEGADLAKWKNEPSLMVEGFFAEDWMDQGFPATVDTERAQLVLGEPGAKYGAVAGRLAHVVNVLSELDAPGEWYIDAATDILSVWPTDKIAAGDMEFSTATTLIDIADSKNITLSKLTLTMVRGDAVIVKKSDNIIVQDAAIRNTGNRAAVFSECSNGGLRNAVIEDTGEGGVSLSGGDRQTLTPSHLFVENSRFRRFSRLSKTYRPAVAMSGVGIRVAGNIMTDAPHAAIIFSGNDHVIEHNNIGRVALESGDAGPIYTGGDWTSRGTIIRENFIHDIIGKAGRVSLKGVFLDDQASGIQVLRNIFFRVDNAIFVGGGRDNLIEGNLIVDSKPPIFFDARGLTWQKKMMNDPKGSQQTSLRRVPFSGALYAARYPHLADIQTDDPGAPKYNIIRDNIVIDSGPVKFIEHAESGVTVGRMFGADDVLFVKNLSAASRKAPADFMLQPQSPAILQGYAPPDVTLIPQE